MSYIVATLIHYNDYPCGESVCPSTYPSYLFHVTVWIDLQNQRNNCYGGYGPGLYYYVLATDIERFADELQTELDALGPYFMGE